MIILKQVIHYPDTNSVEATWVDEISPAVAVPESTAPDTIDAEGNVIPGVVTPAYTIPSVEVQVKCHSYADVQMGLLEADLGVDLSAYVRLIAIVRAGIAPYVPAVKTAAEIQAEIVLSTQQRLDTFAQTRGYDGILSACTYASSSIPHFASEGKSAANLRDATWEALYTLMAQVQAGAHPMPTCFADIEPLLPVLVW